LLDDAEGLEIKTLVIDQRDGRCFRKSMKGFAVVISSGCGLMYSLQDQWHRYYAALACLLGQRD
jgi:hypothetical protein